MQLTWLCTNSMVPYMLYLSLTCTEYAVLNATHKHTKLQAVNIKKAADVRKCLHPIYRNTVFNNVLHSHSNADRTATEIFKNRLSAMEVP